MYHTIEFTAEVLLDLEITRQDRLELVVMRKGARRSVQLKPYVVETPSGPVEVADLFFDDGTSTSAVRYECFSFVE